MMQFPSFHWLSHHGLWAIIPCSTNLVRDSYKNNVGRLVHILGRFSWTHHSTNVCGIWDDYSQLGLTGLVSYLSSNIQSEQRLTKLFAKENSKWKQGYSLRRGAGNAGEWPSRYCFQFCTFLAERMVRVFLDQSQNKVKLKRNNSGLLSTFNWKLLYKLNWS